MILGLLPMLRSVGSMSSWHAAGAWMAKVDADPNGGLSIDQNFFPHDEEFRGRRVHQIRLQGGDASSDSYCYR